MPFSVNARPDAEQRIQRPGSLPRRRTRTSARAPRDADALRASATAGLTAGAGPVDTEPATALPAGTSRRHRNGASALVAVLLLVAAFVASAGPAAPTARAGTITVGACEMASAVINPVDLWRDATNWYWEPYFSNDLPATCADAVNGIQLRTSGSGDIGWDGNTGISVTSPFPAAWLSRLDGAWTTNPSIAGSWIVRAIAFDDTNVQPVVIGCHTAAQCSAFSTTGSPVEIPDDTRYVKWEAVCRSSPCAVRGVDWLWRTSRMTVTLNDPRAPVVVDSSATGSPLTGPARWLRGRQAISIRAEDNGGLGIASTRVLVDGNEISSSNDATCPQQWSRGLWCYESVVTTSTINTTGLADGEHELTIEATDASGNQTQKRSTFRTDNHGDTPTAATVSPSAWTTTNAFDLAWSNPAGASPIVAVHVTRCEHDGSSCATDRIAGADIATVPDRTVPAPGAWPTSIALEDEAGNIGSAIDAGTLRLASAPVATVSPSVTGTARESEQLTSDAGSWRGVPAPAVVDHRWLICDDHGDACQPFAEADSDTVALRPAHVGATFRVEIVARNAGGERTERSAPSAVVRARPPVLTAPPRAAAPTGRAVPPPGATLRDAVTVGGTLDVRGDAWDGTPNLTVDVQWQRCDDRGTDCAAIDGARDRTYAPDRADIGAAIRAEIIATNVGGSATAATEPVLVVDDADPTDPADPPTEEEGQAPPAPTPTGDARVEAVAAVERPAAIASMLSGTAPRASCVRELRVHLPARGRLRVDGNLPGLARVLAGGQVVLRLQTTAEGVSVRNGLGRLLGIARSSAPVSWIRQSARRVTARAADGSALVVLGIDSTLGRAIVKGRTCRFTAPPAARVVARADRLARLSAWLVDEHGSAITNAKVRVTDGARISTRTTDWRGRVRIELGGRGGSRPVTLTFAGDEHHKPTRLDARLTVQGVAELAGTATDARVNLHGKVHGAARTVHVEYLAPDMRWRPLTTAHVARNGRWAVRARTPRQHAGGPQLVMRTVIGAAGAFTARTGGEVRIDLRKAGQR